PPSPSPPPVIPSPTTRVVPSSAAPPPASRGGAGPLGGGRKDARTGTAGVGNGDEEPEEDDEYYSGGLFNIEISPGFKFLEGLKGKKEVGDPSKIEALQDKLRSLHSYLLSGVAYEKSLVKRVKQLFQDVTSQRMEMDKTGTKLFSDNSEIGELKRELLKAQNEVNLAMDREQKLQKDIEDAQRLKGDLVNDIEEIRKHKADMLEPQLIASTKELKLDVLQRRHQVENLEKDLEEKEATYETVTHERERLEMEKERHAVALSQASEMPQKILKQSEVLRDAIGSLVIENVKQTTLAQQLDKELERLGKKRKDLEEHKLDQAADYERRRAETHEMERQCDEIFKQHELAKEQLAVQKGDRVALDLTLRKCNQEIKREHDILLRSIREKEASLKHFRRLETTVNNIRTTTPTIQKQSADYKKLLANAQRDFKHFRKQMSDLRKGIDLGVYEFLKMEGVQREEGERFARERAINMRMEEELEALMARVAELGRLVDGLEMEKELKSREVIRIQNKYRGIRDDIGVKDIAIFDASKRCAEAVNRLKEFATMYDIVKNERNKYLNQIQATMQRAAEMKEKIKILSNEIEILRHEIANKDRELAKRRQENTAAYGQRDTSKNEANKLLAQYREKRDEIDQHLSRIETLNTLINAAESDMLALKTRYESAVRERNASGVHLLDRNDELCILYERLNVQRSVALKGESALNDREDEIRKLSLVVAEIKRRVELGKRVLPWVKECEAKVDALSAELEDVRKRVAELSSKMEDSEDPKRCRNLGGADPGQKELMEKIEHLEELLAEKEEKLLEKDLILEEVSTLTNRLKRQTLEGRHESHAVSSKINDLAKRIKHVTKGMMAKVSELSMHQALAMGLYQEKCEKEALLEEARARLESGQVPTEQIERDFIRAEKARLRREEELRVLREKREREAAGGLVDAEDGEFYLYNNIKTLAEPRPNAYIPDSEVVGELPIPKPYGAHAPFRPQEHGAQFRHFRKPTVKPIEI
ncbi:hypothetical protein HK104_002021, partial [Borealophlyctis nickersoniae]